MPFSISCPGKSTRSINRELRAAIEAGDLEVELLEPEARHNLAVALLCQARVTIRGSVGYYCAGMMDGATVVVEGSAGWGTAESMLGGHVTVRGSAGSGVAASIRGGEVVVHGDAAARAGVSMKGGTLLIGGSCGPMAGFMMQKGAIVICGDAGDALADSMYEGTVFVAGRIESLGNDAVEADVTAEDAAMLERLLGENSIQKPVRFRKIVSGRKLWNFDRKEMALWKVAL